VEEAAWSCTSLCSAQARWEGDATGAAVWEVSQAAKVEDCSAVMSACVGPNVAWVRNRPVSADVKLGVVVVVVPEEPDEEDPDEELLLSPQPVTIQQTATRIARRICRIINAPAPLVSMAGNKTRGKIRMDFLSVKQFFFAAAT